MESRNNQFFLFYFLTNLYRQEIPDKVLKTSKYQFLKGIVCKKEDFFLLSLYSQM